MHTYGMDNPDFVYAASADYDIDCNWKVRGTELRPYVFAASSGDEAASVSQFTSNLDQHNAKDSLMIVAAAVFCTMAWPHWIPWHSRPYIKPAGSNRGCNLPWHNTHGCI